MAALFLFFLWLTSPAPQTVPLIQTPAPAPQVPPAPSAPQAPAAPPPGPQTGPQAVGSTLQASASYQVGPGDTLRVIGNNGRESFDQTLLVGPDGMVLVPFSVNQLIK